MRDYVLEIECLSKRFMRCEEEIKISVVRHYTVFVTRVQSEIGENESIPDFVMK